jgi:dienelactone hydrolase
MRLMSIAVVGWCAIAIESLAQVPPDHSKKAIEAALAELSAKLAADPQRDELRQSLGRSLREQIAEANRRSSAEWSKITSRNDWEAFRAEKIKALRESLGKLPERPPVPKLQVTGELAGDGFKIRNLVYQSRPGLVVTANLYVPDPPRPSMPGLMISHSHHHPKHEGELQDMGMTWARAGCYVLVPDHLGHGERRQHPFASEADFPQPFPVSRQDYNFRYDASLQLYLVGESLMGWMVHDLMTGVDVLLAQPGIDPNRIILLGAVAGGGDPAAVTAALDERIACTCPFNFGGPQPENRYPLAEDAETTFNYAGSGSWESTRNLRNSAAEGFLPWVIVGSIAPRKLIHAHEFSWDRARDPVWKRYEKIWGFYDAQGALAFAHGHGTIQVNVPPGSHCNNIGAVHRRQIHESFRRWFAIDVQPADEYSKRKSREELTCLTAAAREAFDPQPLHVILSKLANERLAKARAVLTALTAGERLIRTRDSWSRLLGDTEPLREIKVREDSRQVLTLGPITATRELLETGPGVVTRVLTLSRTELDGRKERWRPVILGLASDGIESILERRKSDLLAGLEHTMLIVLVDVRGVDANGPGTDHGQQSAATAHSATALMLGQPLLGLQLRDLRTAWRHIQMREDVKPDELVLAGGAGETPLAAGAAFAYPRRIDRPRECEPTGALLALLMCLFEDHVAGVNSRLGLVSYRSILDSPFVQVPHEAIVPGVLSDGDLSDLVAALAAQREVAIEGPVDGRGRRVPVALAEEEYALAKRTFAQAGAVERLQIVDLEDLTAKP